MCSSYVMANLTEILCQSEVNGRVGRQVCGRVSGLWLGARGKIYFVPAAKFALQIRPEFFQDIGRHIDADLHAELVGASRAVRLSA